MHIVLFSVILIGRGVLVGERFICVFDILCGDVFRIVVVHQKVIVKIVTAEFFFLAHPGSQCNHQTHQGNSKRDQRNQHTFFMEATPLYNVDSIFVLLGFIIPNLQENYNSFWGRKFSEGNFL